MKILIFSWKDIKHPHAGGAEIYTFKIAESLIKTGQQITLVSSSFPNAKHQETLKGINIYRPFSFNPRSPLTYFDYLIQIRGFYQDKLAGQFDLVIDQVHGLPHFTPLFVKEKVILIPMEVAGKIWLYEFPFPTSLIGYLLETLYIKLFKNIPFITISSSTVKELKKLGVKKVIHVNPGVGVFKEINPGVVIKKAVSPLFISLSRITPMKRIDQTILAFQQVTWLYPQAQLYIIGKGKLSYLNKLKKLINKLDLQKQIKFLGYVFEKQKRVLLSQAWAILSTSIKEGWGINIMEAASLGTPALVYRSPGLIDTVKDKETGLITKKNQPDHLAKLMMEIIENPILWKNLSQNARKFSYQFSWQKSASRFLRIIQKVC